MRTNLLYYFLIMFVGLFASCETPVDLQLDFKPELVVISNFAPSQRIEVQVSATRSPLNTADTEYIANAKVDLYQGQKFLETLRLIPGGRDTPPFYLSNIVNPQAGITYTIKVQVPDFESIEASSSIPAPTPIKSLVLSELTNGPGTKPLQVKYSYEATLNFTDPANQVNYYHLNFYQQLYKYRVEKGDTIITGAIFFKRKFSSVSDENTMIAYFDGGVLFEDTGVDGKLVTLTLPLDIELFPDRELLGNVYAELRTVSKEYYLYHNSLSRQQTSSSGPFTEPVILYNNIENGQGIFAGYNPTLDSTAIKR